MLFLGLGIILLALKYFEIGPVAGLSWWLVLAPFALAAVWWGIADMTGYTKRKAMERMDRRTQERKDKQREALIARPGDRGRK
ncbi:MAG: TIGR04438 family Trp-rich protein [Pseudomonadota bacterium]